MDERIVDIRAAIAENEQRLKEQAANAIAAYQDDKANAKIFEDDFHATVEGFLDEAENAEELKKAYRQAVNQSKVETSVAEAAVQQFSESADKASAMSKAFKKAAAAAKAKKDGGVDKPADHSL